MPISNRHGLQTQHALFLLKLKPFYLHKTCQVRLFLQTALLEITWQPGNVFTGELLAIDVAAQRGTTVEAPERHSYFK